jgi:hypothetical protein
LISCSRLRLLLTVFCVVVVNPATSIGVSTSVDSGFVSRPILKIYHLCLQIQNMPAKKKPPIGTINTSDVIWNFIFNALTSNLSPLAYNSSKAANQLLAPPATPGFQKLSIMTLVESPNSCCSAQAADLTLTYCSKNKHPY